MFIFKIFIRQDLKVPKEKTGAFFSLECAFAYIFDHFYFEKFIIVLIFLIKVYKIFLFIFLPSEVAQEFGRHFLANLTSLTISTECH